MCSPPLLSHGLLLLLLLLPALNCTLFFAAESLTIHTMVTTPQKLRSLLTISEGEGKTHKDKGKKLTIRNLLRKDRGESLSVKAVYTYREAEGRSSQSHNKSHEKTYEVPSSQDGINPLYVDQLIPVMPEEEEGVDYGDIVVCCFFTVVLNDTHTYTKGPVTLFDRTVRKLNAKNATMCRITSEGIFLNNDRHPVLKWQNSEQRGRKGQEDGSTDTPTEEQQDGSSSKMMESARKRSGKKMGKKMAKRREISVHGQDGWLSCADCKGKTLTIRNLLTKDRGESLSVEAVYTYRVIASGSSQSQNKSHEETYEVPSSKDGINPLYVDQLIPVMPEEEEEGVDYGNIVVCCFFTVVLNGTQTYAKGPVTLFDRTVPKLNSKNVTMCRITSKGIFLNNDHHPVLKWEDSRHTFWRGERGGKRWEDEIAEQQSRPKELMAERQDISVPSFSYANSDHLPVEFAQNHQRGWDTNNHFGFHHKVGLVDDEQQQQQQHPFVLHHPGVESYELHRQSPLPFLLPHPGDESYDLHRTTVDPKDVFPAQHQQHSNQRHDEGQP